jgi:hypothetical protein
MKTAIVTLVLALSLAFVAAPASAAPVTVNVPMTDFTPFPNFYGQSATAFSGGWGWSTPQPALIRATLAVPEGCEIVSANVGGFMADVWVNLSADVTSTTSVSTAIASTGALGGFGGWGSYSNTFAVNYTPLSTELVFLVVRSQAYGWALTSAKFTYDCD